MGPKKAARDEWEPRVVGVAKSEEVVVVDTMAFRNGRIKIRAAALLLLAPWWFDWPPESWQEWLVVALAALFTLSPALNYQVGGTNGVRLEKFMDGIVAMFLGFALFDNFTAAVFLIAVLASPEDAVFLLPVTLFLRVVCAVSFSLAALIGSRIRWYQAFIRGFEGGGFAGYQLAQALRQGTVSDWIKLYGRGLYRLIKES